jgi:hypothetical protein
MYLVSQSCTISNYTLTLWIENSLGSTTFVKLWLASVVVWEFVLATAERWAAVCPGLLTVFIAVYKAVW